MGRYPAETYRRVISSGTGTVGIYLNEAVITRLIRTLFLVTVPKWRC